MKIHSCFITYNRLELTKQAIESYLETTTVPSTLIVVDNASTDGTQEWLAENKLHWLPLIENRYPGYACNRGWEDVGEDADFLHRADNDFAFLPGWVEQVAHLFQTDKIGQVGLRTDEEELYAPWNVGGNCIIRRSLWDAGLRYDERPWPEFPPGYSEDSFFSPAVEQMTYEDQGTNHHYTWKRVKEPCIRSLASGDLEDEYYIRSYGDRGIVNADELRQQLGTT